MKKVFAYVNGQLFPFLNKSGLLEANGMLKSRTEWEATFPKGNVVWGLSASDVMTPV